MPRHTHTENDLLRLVEGDAPLFAVALHDGHILRAEIDRNMALPEEVRLREEDPFTGAWAEVAPTRLISHRSRFEVDLNRPRDHAIYVHPADAWGLQVWKSPLTSTAIDASLAEYDAFYATAYRTLSELERRYGRFVVLDIHSYNHQRNGPGGRYDSQEKHPDVNVGTGSMNRQRWAPVVDRAIRELTECDDLGRRLDVRENVKFLGGQFPRWVHETFPETGCAIAIEFKKFFMDEWSGQLYVHLHQGIRRLLAHLVEAMVDEVKQKPA